MAQLIFHVENQYIHRLDEFHVVARSNNYLYAEFTFSDDWVGEKTALFSVEADSGEIITKPMLIGADGTCEVPHEVLEYDNSQLEVSAFCGNRVTANVAVVPVHESGYNDDSAPDDPTPDVYTQILNRLANVEQIVVEKAIEAESWAVGGTGTRTDEDIDNSKYYSEQASQSATNAAQSATNASESATSASGSASAASASAGIASEKATEATTAKASIDIAVEEIRGIETNVRTYSQNAAHSAEEASETISVVRGYSETASQSARSASSSASDASASATSASGSASRASGYATNAQNYAAASERSMQSAATSERNAAQSSTDAAAYASNAEESATNSALSASDSNGYAGAALQSANEALEAQTAAESARDDAVAAKTVAETMAQVIQSSAQQIATNTQNIATNTENISQNTTDIADVKEDLSQLQDSKADIIISSAEGTVASFLDGAEYDAVSLIAHFEPVQEGTGDPSPDNVRPIHGWTGLNILTSGEDMTNPTTTPISWQTEAGEVFGGYADVTRGKVVSEWEMVSGRWGDIKTSMVSSTTNLQRAVMDYQNVILVTNNQGRYGINSLCNVIGTVLWNGESTAPEHFYTANVSNKGRAYVFLNENTPDETVVQIISKLATPIEYDITPQQIALLKGYNNIWNSAGGHNEVQYKADTKLYIENKQLDFRNTIAPIEDGDTASQAYAVGRYFYRNGAFCKAKAAIASGAAFTLNTNYEVTSVANELYTALH